MINPVYHILNNTSPICHNKLLLAFTDLANTRDMAWLEDEVNRKNLVTYSGLELVTFRLEA
jgi:hypothetical protein